MDVATSLNSKLYTVYKENCKYFYFPFNFIIKQHLFLFLDFSNNLIILAIGTRQNVII